MVNWGNKEHTHTQTNDKRSETDLLNREILLTVCNSENKNLFECKRVTQERKGERYY